MSYYIKTDAGLLEMLNWTTAFANSGSAGREPLLPWADPASLDIEIQTSVMLDSPLRIAKGYSVLDGERVVCQLSVDTCLPDGRGHFLIQGRTTGFSPGAIFVQGQSGFGPARPHA